MKRLIIILIFLQFSNIGFSQDYIPMAESDKYWIYEHVYNSQTGAIDYGYMLGIGRDTVINDIDYKQLNEFDLAGSYPCQVPPCWRFEYPYKVLGVKVIGYIRDDISSRKVYFLPNDISSSNNITCGDMQEYVLFDFSVSIGDTLSSCYKLRDLFDDKTGIVDSLGIYNHRYSIFSSGPSGVGGLPYIGEKIISEGLGFLDYGLFHDWYFPLVDFCKGSWEDCNIISSINIIHEKIFLEISPNPSSGIIKIKTSKQIISYNMYNLSGKKVLSGKYMDSIDMSSLTQGIYILKLLLNDGIVTKRVVKINQK